MLKVILIGVVVTIVAVASFAIIGSMQNDNGLVNDQPTQEVESDASGKCKITGQVMHEGSYTISEDTTISDLISKAGGVTDKADENAYNLDLVIGVRKEIYIARVLSTSSTMCITNETNKCNINTVASSELSATTGLNITYCDAIISYREENGNYFECIDDVKNVKNIGASRFNQIKDWITIY